MIPLDSLKPGEEAIIRSFESNSESNNYLMEMGLTPGTRVKLVKFAPLGDPMELNVRGYHLSVRRSEAKHVLIERKISSTNGRDRN